MDVVSLRQSDLWWSRQRRESEAWWTRTGMRVGQSPYYKGRTDGQTEREPHADCQGGRRDVQFIDRLHAIRPFRRWYEPARSEVPPVYSGRQAATSLTTSGGI